MNFTQAILSSDLLSSFGWTIIHSIWIGGIIFILSLLLLYFLRNSKANYRYIISVGSLLTFLILVTIAFFKIYALQSIQYNLNIPLSENFVIISNNLLEVSNLSKFTDKFSLSGIENYINQNIPLMVVIWLLGLLFFSFRFMGGLLYTYRLRSQSKKTKNENFNSIIHQVSQKIGLRSKVQLRESSFISTPMVIGFIKPIILLPLGMANGLSLHQVEAILFHEIAHIYRFDYLVNLIQSIVEVVLFYHPVVWWLSAHIRAERENICDDIAIQHTGNALNYAKALTSLQELNNQTPDIVVAFSNKKYRFMNRIRRLLGLPQINNNLMEGLVSTFLLIISIILFSTHAGPVFAEDNRTNIEDEISLNEANLSSLIEVEQEKKVKQQKTDAIAIEKKLFESQKKIEISAKKISSTKKTFMANLEKMKLKTSKSGTVDETAIDGFRKKSIVQTKSIMKDLDVLKKNHGLISEKFKSLSPKIDKVVATQLKKKLLKNKEMLIKTMEKAKIATQFYMLSSKQFSAKSKIIKIKDKQQLMEKKQKQQLQMQKEMTYKMQKMEQSFQKEIEFKKQKIEQARQKLQQAEKLNIDKDKLKEMQKKLQIQEMDFKAQMKDQKLKLKGLESKLKDQITDFREIEEIAEIEMAEKVKMALEVEMANEVEMAEEVEMAKEAEMIAEVEMPQEMEMEREMDEDIIKARLANKGMVEKEMAYKKVIETFSKQLAADGLLNPNGQTEFELSTKKLSINGKDQSKKLFRKYTKLLVDTRGDKLSDDKKFILNLD
jgi:bla regulator protein blaR1